MKQIKRKSKRFNHKAKTKTFQQHLTEIPDENGMYPIHIAIQNNDLGTLEDLIDKGININKYNRDKDTPLLLAIKENNIQILEKLLEEGVDLNRSDTNQNSPLDVATNLQHQECIDLLIEHGSSQPKSASKETKYLNDNSAEFVDSLIELLDNKIRCNTNSVTTQLITKEIILLLKQYLNLKKIPSAINTKLKKDINQKIVQFTNTSKNNTQVTKKDILNLTRKVIVSIQDHKTNLSKDSVWNLNKIESLIEEKIVTSAVESEKLSAYIFVSNSTAKKEESQDIEKPDENWYSQNGYKDFEEFIRINNLGAGSINFLKFSIIKRDNILQKTYDHSTESLETITIRPSHLTNKKDFLLLVPDALKRIKEEQKLFEYNSDEWQLFNKLLSKLQKGSDLSLDENLKLDKTLRPGKKDKIHLIHFHHNDGYEPFWHDFTKEAFLTGATIHLFNHLPAYYKKTDLIYSGIAIVNNLLDQDIHPDKIILQSYGSGYPISKEVKNQFEKRGIDLAQINYQHSLFSPTIFPECICDHRKLNIYFDKAYNTKTSFKEDTPYEFLKFAEYIAKNLKHSNQDTKTPYLTDAVSKNYSLTQLINIFITTTQHFLKQNILHKNPPLPQERVENILGIINV